jgi:uncharacterized membrane protein
MFSRHIHYLPIGLPAFAFFVAVVVVLLILVQLRVLHFAYRRLGLSSGTAFMLLVGSLLGSYFNIPVAQLADRQVPINGEIDAFGEAYYAPLVQDWPGTIVAINVGGALIPGAVSLYLLARNNLWVKGAIGVAVVAVICHILARPVPGLGIAMPGLVPGIAAAIVAFILAPSRAAPLAYIAGSLGVLIGADLSNVDKINGLGAPVASIGGAGAFDGIFLTGVVAVLIASFPSLGRREEART